MMGNAAKYLLAAVVVIIGYSIADRLSPKGGAIYIIIIILGIMLFNRSAVTAELNRVAALIRS